jgi:hypothetical protein
MTTNDLPTNPLAMDREAIACFIYSPRVLHALFSTRRSPRTDEWGIVPMTQVARCPSLHTRTAKNASRKHGIDSKVSRSPRYTTLSTTHQQRLNALKSFKRFDGRCCAPLWYSEEEIARTIGSCSVCQEIASEILYRNLLKALRPASRRRSRRPATEVYPWKIRRTKVLVGKALIPKQLPALRFCVSGFDLCKGCDISSVVASDQEHMPSIVGFEAVGSHFISSSAGA